MGCGASHDRAEPAGLVPVVPTAASTPAAASEKAEKAAAENLVAEADGAVASTTEEANAEKATASRSGSEADDEQTNALALSDAALSFGQLFELTTPMLVMPFRNFKAQGRIMKSTKAWRDEALAAGSLIVHEEGSSKIVIFISHTWWDRSFTDATNDPNNPYDVGAPDFQADYPDYQREILVGTGDMLTYQRPKNLKWHVICAGVQRLLEQEGLKEEEVSLWVDWQSIYQDDEAEKLKGVASLIRYATLCQYMLVPTEEAVLWCFGSPEHIPVYGSRGWCRIEYFVFSLLAEMRGQQVQLYGIERDGDLQRYPMVQVYGEEDMPSGGALSNPNDQALVKDLEDKMIDAYGTALVEVECKAGGGERVHFGRKMLRPQHVGALFAAVERYQVTGLDLTLNQLGAEGGALVAAALKTNTTLTWLQLNGNKLGPEGGMALAEALKSNTTLKLMGNQLGPEGGMALAEALKSNTTIEWLDLLNTQLGPEVGMALAEAIKSNATLKGLRLRANELGPEGGMALAEALKSNTTLNLLEDKRGLGDVAKQALRAAARSGLELDL